MKSKTIPFSFVLLNLESVERKGKSYNKHLNISRTKRLFIVFDSLSFGEKNKKYRIQGGIGM